MKTKLATCVLLCLLHAVPACAKKDTYTSAAVTGITWGSATSFSTAVPQAPVLGGSLIYMTKSLSAFIRLSLNTREIPANLNPFTARVAVSIEYYTEGSATPIIENGKVLEIDYSPVTGARYKNVDVLEIKNCRSIKVTLTAASLQLTGPVTLNQVRGFISINAFIEHERFYNYCNIFGAGPAVSQVANNIITLYNSGNNELLVAWPVIQNVEGYELEYTFVDDYADAGFLLPSQVSFSFQHNSTRIIVAKNNYLLPLVQEHGFYFFRVRGYSMAGPGFDQLFYGPYSANTGGANPNQTFTAATYPYLFTVDAGLTHTADKINWQAVTSFAEEGKSKTVVQYMDGTLRTRQTVTTTSTERNAIVAETVYDRQGRPAVNILPAPVNSAAIGYYGNFNQNMAGQPYSYTDFDVKITNSCYVNINPLKQQSNQGAANYYSQYNLRKTTFNAFIPEAHGFPFTKVNYMPDATDRVVRQGGVGETFQPGSTGHDTRYYYGQPEQYKLDRLFGTNAGYASYYQKNLVVDANGQASVTYTNLDGKTIATALAGPAPPNVDALRSVVPDTIEVNLLQKSDVVDPEKHSITGSQAFLVSANNTPYHFTYSLQANSYNALSCAGRNYCLDCIYDLEIRLVNDECGKIEYAHTKTVGRLDDLNFICNDAHADTAFGFSALLNVGSYTITRKLTVNKEAAEKYADSILNDTLNTCLESFEDFYEEAWNNRDTLRCKEPCAACTAETQTDEPAAAIAAAVRACDSLWCNPQLTTMCDVARMSMINDLRPGGQYAIWKEFSPISIFNAGTNPYHNSIFSGAPGFWGIPTIPVTLPGEPTQSLVYYMGSMDLLTQLVDNWPDDLSEKLLPLHPEYCYLQFCQLEYMQRANAFDTKLMNALTLADAQAAFGAVTVNAVNIHQFYQEDILWQNLPNTGINFLQGAMQQRFIDYTGHNNSIVQLALFMANCPSGNNIAACPAAWGDGQNDDEEWEKFKLIFFSLKQEFLQKAREHYVLNTAGCCPNYYIGCTADVNCPPFIWHPFSATFNGGPCLNNANFAYKGATRRFTTINDMKFPGMPRPDESLYDMAPDKLAGQMTDSAQNSLCPTCPELEAFKMTIWHLQEKKWLQKDTSIMADAVIGMKDVLRQRFMGTQNNGPIHISHNGNEISIGSGSCTIRFTADTVIDWATADIFPTCLEITSYRQAALHILVNDSFKTVLRINSTCDLFYCDGPAPQPPVLNDDCKCDSVYQNTRAYRLGDVVRYNGSCYVSKKPNRSNEMLTPGNNPDNKEYWSRVCEYRACTDPFTIDFESAQIFRTDLTLVNVIPQSDQYFIRIGTNYPSMFNSNCLICRPTTPGKLFFGKTAPVKPHQDYRVSFQIMGGGYPTLPPQSRPREVQFFINSKLFQAIPIQPNNHPHVPFNYSFNWNSGSETTVNIEFISKNVEIGGIVSIDNIKMECIGSGPSPAGAGSAKQNTLDSSRYIPANACGCEGVCNIGTPMPPMPIIACDSIQKEIAMQQATEAWGAYRDSVFKAILNGYYAHCMQAAETFMMDYADPEYHYTLYYYDQSDNLVRTVPPAGVRPLSDAQTASVEAFRSAGNGTGLLPPHFMASSYRHNSLNAVVRQQTPDAGMAEFFYDQLGRIALSRNAKQAPMGQASYTYYDALGRTVEAGAVNLGFLGTNLLKNLVLNYTAWEGVLNTRIKTEITRTYYDKPASTAISNAFGAQGQQYLRNRIGTVAVYTNKVKLAALDYEQATHYSYDVAGNVNNLLQDFGANSPFGSGRIRFQSKHIAYSYDLVSGKVNSVRYQPGYPDQFIYRYQYNADNKLTHVFTSRDGVIWENDARYYYYRHGPLARTELATDNVQGLDYAYTLQGWVKGVNGFAGSGTTDMGQDGNPSPADWFNASSGPFPVATSPPKTTADVYSYWLSYYQTDYEAIGRSNAVVAGVTAPLTTGPYHTAPANLFNGNIGSMFTRLQPFGAMGMQYRYDQLNRIKKQEAWSFTGATATPAIANAYTMALEYDPNGNIQKLLRNGTTALPGMDSLNYSYYNANNTVYAGDPAAFNATNKLARVTDNVPNGNYATDIDNQPVRNYRYDAIGNLVRDVSEGINNISWNLQNKISRLQKNSGLLINYEYDALGNRIMKRVTQSGQVQNEFYVRDAQGNTLAIYTLNGNNLRWAEQHLYGSSRLGMQRPDAVTPRFDGLMGQQLLSILSLQSQQTFQTRSTQRNSTEYELTNHLGHVLATITDAKTAPPTGTGGTATILTATDYCAFGMGMPGREYNSNLYRHGYQGSEKDDEISGRGNLITTFYRELDTRLGRWWGVDPKAMSYESPYISMGNNPVLYNDPMGDIIHANLKTWVKLINAAIVSKEIRQRLWAQQTDKRTREAMRTDKHGDKQPKTIKQSQHYHYTYNPNTEKNLSDAMDETESKRQSKEDDNKTIMSNYFSASFNVEKSESFYAFGQGKGGTGNDGSGKFDSKEKTITSDASYQNGVIDISFSPNVVDEEGDRLQIYKGTNLIYDKVVTPDPDVLTGHRSIRVNFNNTDGKRGHIRIKISGNDTKKPGAYEIKGTIKGF